MSLEVTALVEWWERFSQRPLIAHLLRTIDRFTVRGGSQFAAAIAYFSVLSLVPILMLAFSGLGLALTVFYPDYLTSLEDWLNSNLSAYGDLGQTMLAIVSSSLSNWAAIGLVGLAISFWSGANWMGNLKRAVRALMREDYDNPPKSLPLPLDLLANFGALLLLFLGVGLIWTATVATTTFGERNRSDPGGGGQSWLDLAGPNRHRTALAGSGDAAVLVDVPVVCADSGAHQIDVDRRIHRRCGTDRAAIAGWLPDSGVLS